MHLSPFISFNFWGDFIFHRINLFHAFSLRPVVVVLSLADKNMFIPSQQISMENDYLGPRRIEALKKEDFDWQKKAQEAVLNIQEFTVKYFEITARAQKGAVCHHCHCQCQVNKPAEEWLSIITDPIHTHSGSIGLLLTCLWFWTPVLMWFGVNEAVQTAMLWQGQEETRTTYWSNSSASRLSLCRITPPCAPAYPSFSSLLIGPFIIWHLLDQKSNKWV